MKILRKIIQSVLFAGFYLVKLISANLYIAYDILTPKMRTRPGTIEMDVDLSTDRGILLLSNLVSMTPGTLTMDYDRDLKKLLVHLLYMDRQEATRREIGQIMNRIRLITE